MRNSDKKILIIEDDEAMRSLLRDFLDEEGFDTDSVSNGYDALRKLADRSFDLIITDVQMPGLTGLDILPRIKRLHPDATVIVITAFGSDELHRRSFEKGAAGYLQKPIHVNQLRALIYEVVSSKEKMRGGQRAS